MKKSWEHFSKINSNEFEGKLKECSFSEKRMIMNYVNKVAYSARRKYALTKECRRNSVKWEI